MTPLRKTVRPHPTEQHASTPKSNTPSARKELFFRHNKPFNSLLQSDAPPLGKAAFLRPQSDASPLGRQTEVRREKLLPFAPAKRRYSARITTLLRPQSISPPLGKAALLRPQSDASPLGRQTEVRLERLLPSAGAKLQNVAPRNPAPVFRIAIKARPHKSAFSSPASPQNFTLRASARPQPQSE